MAPNEQISGGAQIGWSRASWPLATLSASANNLSISALLLGSYSFSPDEVVALEAHGWIPIVGRGIRIVHSRSDYPAKIVFWCFWSPHRVIEYIRNAGFVPRASSASLPMRQRIPVRWPAIALAVVLWNTLFLIDGFVPWNKNPTPGSFVFLALSLLFVASVIVHRSAMAQSLVLKQGRSVDEIRGILVMLQVVTGTLIFLMLIFAVLGVLPANPTSRKLHTDHIFTSMVCARQRAKFREADAVGQPFAPADGRELRPAAAELERASVDAAEQPFV